MKTIMYKFVVITMSLTVALSIYLVYLAFWPFKPAEFLNIPFPVQQDTVCAGDVVGYTLEYHKKMEVPVKVTEMLVNHVQITFPPTETCLPSGDYRFINKNVIIPKFTGEGNAYIHITCEYRVNPLRTIVVTGKSKPFYIRENY